MRNLQTLPRLFWNQGIPRSLMRRFLARQQRDPFKKLADRLGVPIRILYFHADEDVLRHRIRGRHREGSDISEADHEAEKVLSLVRQSL